MYTPHYFKNENLAEVREFIDHNGFGILVSCDRGVTLRQAQDDVIGSAQGDASYPIATHIPLLLDKDDEGRDILSGHIARMNPQHKLFTPDSKVLAIFHGPHTYVSSSWYANENVPTWNYIAVHVTGTMRIIEGDRLYRQLKMLVDKYEEISSKATLRQAQDDYAGALDDFAGAPGDSARPFDSAQGDERVSTKGDEKRSTQGDEVGGRQMPSSAPAQESKRVYLEKMSDTYIKKQMNGIVGFEILIENIQASYKLSQNRAAEDHANIIAQLEKRGDPQSLAIAEEMKKKRE